MLHMGFQADSSAEDRLHRIENAWQLFLKEPLWGNGWGQSGWVHSDLLQIAANLGGVALLVFLLWYGATFVKVWRVYKSRTEPWVRDESVALLTFLVGFIFILGTQAVIVLPQMIHPMWLLFALSDRLGQINESKSSAQVFNA